MTKVLNYIREEEEDKLFCLEMAADKSQVAVSSAGSELKYLAFVKTVALQAIAWALNLYAAAQARLGALPCRIESAVTAHFAPVYTKFKGHPDKVLQFLDNKIDALAKVYDKGAPSFVKEGVSAALNATELAVVAMKEGRVNGPRAAVRYIVGEIYQAIQSLFAKFRQFLHALFMKISQYLVSKFVAVFLEAIKTPTVRKALSPLIPTIIVLFGKCKERIPSVLGEITRAMDKSAAAVSGVPVVGGAAKAAAGVASAAQTTLASAVENGFVALTEILLVELAKTAAAADTVNSLTEGTVT